MCARESVRRITTLAAPLLLAALVTSCCSTWKSQSKPPRDLLEWKEGGVEPPDKIRVHDVAGRSIVVYGPAIRGDSLLGLVDSKRVSPESSRWAGPGSVTSYTERRPSSIPLDSIGTVDIRGISAGKTLIGWGIGLGILAGILAATWEPMY